MCGLTLRPRDDDHERQHDQDDLNVVPSARQLEQELAPADIKLMMEVFDGLAASGAGRVNVRRAYLSSDSLYAAPTLF